MEKQHTSGFTLIELAVVITIIAILTAMILPVFAGIVRSSNQQTCINNLRNIGTMLAQYRQDNGVYPAAPLAGFLHAQYKSGVPLSEQQVIVSSPVFTGDGNSTGFTVDASSFRGRPPMQYIVQIDDDSTTPNTFKWSADGGVSWPANKVAITATKAQWLNDGMQITFTSAGGHVVGDTWSFKVNPLAPALPEGQVLKPVILTKPAAEGDTSVTVSSTTGLVVGMHALVHSADLAARGTDAVVINTIAGNTVTFSPALLYDYTTTDPYDVNNYGVLDPRTGNFGLATLYFTYVDEGRNAELRGSATDTDADLTHGPSFFHCPQMHSTVDANKPSKPTPPPPPDADVPHHQPEIYVADAHNRKVDPLWSGYNTYDMTYNYDQYDGTIRALDGALGYGTLHTARQLQNPNAPADTVVCWCYGHKQSQLPTYYALDPSVPDVDGNLASARHAETGRRTERDVVLWLDGSINVMTPTLVRAIGGTDDKAKYFWTPPFLYAPGDRLK